MSINYVDIAIIVLAAIFCIVGYCRGFLRSLTKLMGSFLSLILAIFLCKPVTMLIIAKTPLDELMQSAFSGWFAKIGPVMTTPIGEGASELIREGLSSVGLPGFLINWITPALLKLIPAGTEQTLAVLCAGYITQAILVVCSTILLFVVVRLIVFLLNKLIALFLKDKLLKIVDRIFGIAFGALKTLVTVFIVFALGSYFVEQPYAEPVRAQIQGGAISSVMYNNNPVQALVDEYLQMDEILQQIKDFIAGGSDKPSEESGPEETPEAPPETEVPSDVPPEQTAPA